MCNLHLWIRLSYYIRYGPVSQMLPRPFQGAIIQAEPMVAAISVVTMLRGYAVITEAEVIAELSQYPEEIITKHRYGGFFGTLLEQKLREFGRHKLVVCGVAADTFAFCRPP
jgi:nicotinamidase-related amidase